MGRLIRRFAIPAIISMLVNAVYNIVDQVFIGFGIGFLGIAATNVAFPLTTISTAMALLLGVGGASNFNLQLGAGKRDGASGIVGNALSLMVIGGGALGVLSLVLLQPMLVFFGATEQSMPLALPYTGIIAVGLPFVVFTTGATNLIRADGSPTYSMVVILSGAVFNLIFDPVFLFVFNMGIQGIALATTLGQVLSAALALAYLLRRFKSVPLARHHLRPRARHVKAICALGMASCFNQIAMTVVQIVMNNALRHYGALSAYGSDIPLAAVGAISKINILFMAFSIGTAQGCQPIISYNYGARQYARVKQAYRTAVIFTSCVAVAAFLIFQLFPRQVMAIFGEDDPLYLAFAVQYLKVFMFATFVNGVQPVTANFFSSIGKARTGIWLSLTRQILFLLPLIIILPTFLGIEGVMVAGPIADFAAFGTAMLLITREWRKISALQAAQISSPAQGGDPT